MKRTLFTLAVLLLALPAALHAADSDLRKPVRIETGLVEGVPNQAGTVVAFKGIPYAAPPVGNLRWREPQPPAHWEGVRKADAFGPSCPQPPGSGLPPYTKDLFGHQEQGDQSEDCLFLNVWTPAKSAADKLPVLFFVHGENYTTGSGRSNILDGEALAGKGIIVVTVNFRLGILAGMGHPQLTAESPHHVCGNYGMLDIIAALKWVHDNIAAFGGDPGKVTLCGQSSGGMNFVKTVNPNGENLPLWKPFDTSDPSTMVLGEKTGPRRIAGKERMEFYRGLLEK
jgi:para-nitrobenzyl esterase